ncbi:hypothetical protein [Bradyrhizobium sp. G127]|uniref:hypothetical protein n=1 Tax=Bradyrhizobium sp. G127 TaxID=2904800 RepID=UPI001F383AD9|nr:hypothetical protein [Bradyrhizobium sp. G127]MCF2525404.1 hypothetical protein [Bradyrhizobium sp. G127]
MTSELPPSSSDYLAWEILKSLEALLPPEKSLVSFVGSADDKSASAAQTAVKRWYRRLKNPAKGSPVSRAQLTTVVRLIRNAHRVEQELLDRRVWNPLEQYEKLQEARDSRKNRWFVPAGFDAIKKEYFFRERLTKLQISFGDLKDPKEFAEIVAKIIAGRCKNSQFADALNIGDMFIQLAGIGNDVLSLEREDCAALVGWVAKENAMVCLQTGNLPRLSDAINQLKWSADVSKDPFVEGHGYIAKSYRVRLTMGDRSYPNIELGEKGFKAIFSGRASRLFSSKLKDPMAVYGGANERRLRGVSMDTVCELVPGRRTIAQTMEDGALLAESQSQVSVAIRARCNLARGFALSKSDEAMRHIDVAKKLLGSGDSQNNANLANILHVEGIIAEGLGRHEDAVDIIEKSRSIYKMIGANVRASDVHFDHRRAILGRP